MESVDQHKERLGEWLEGLKVRDPDLHAELATRLRERTPEASAFEMARETPPAAAWPMVLETIVREGRPALLIQNDQMTRSDPAVDAAASTIVDRLFTHADTLNPVIPLVGRIDVANYAGGLEYVGTGWLVDPSIIVTNRHVAELIARRGPDGFVFVPGRFGDPIGVTIDYRHEADADTVNAVRVKRVVWIEPDAAAADIAFLEVEGRPDGLVQNRILIASADAAPGDNVAVVGYPARAPSSIIPDQAWMDRIYGGRYDIKRIAPGLMEAPSKGWATHDCTTLGGNSGSVVLDMGTGAAVALHFAGLYMVENYAVPASTIRRYLCDRPWHPKAPAAKPPEVPAVRVEGATDAGAAMTSTTTASLTFNLPVTVTVSIGAPGAAGGTPMMGLDAAVDDLAARIAGHGVLAVKAGLVVDGGALVDEPCIVVAAHPGRLNEVRQRVAPLWAGYRVQVRPASLQDQLGDTESLVSEAPATITYDDANRTGPDYSFDWIEEPMKLRCHVGPERGFEELAAFLAEAHGELVSSMYQFYIDHIRAAVETQFSAMPPARMRIVLDPQTHDSQGETPDGQFNRSSTFARWAQDFGFERIYVPEGSGGFVSKAYHIKVTVRDGEAFWLSSGNWTKASQPLIAAADRMDPAKTGRAGNREWHVVGVNETLSARLRAHILQDFAACQALGGRPEAPDDEIMVDVPRASLEAAVAEAAPAKVVEPLVLERKVRVRPLLTPDGQQGGVYGDAVMALIEGATRQLLFQNQYITVSKTSAGRFGDLVDALVARAKVIDDCRIILRADGSGFWDSIAELKRRGLDVARCVRRLANTHTKGIIVDGRQVLVGSQNWSQAAVTVNRDASLLFNDPEIAGYYADVFEIDWARANKLTDPPLATVPGPARLAEGPAPPDGFRRMTLGQYLE